MALTKARGNMYNWVSHLWSPIRGCRFKCVYCYAKKYGYGDQVTFTHKELDINLGKGKTIFVNHLSDMWGDWITDQIINHILNRCRDFPDNIYVFQTKNPRRYHGFSFNGIHALLGTTIETDNYGHRIVTEAPPLIERVIGMERLKLPKFITIEPIMDFNLLNLIWMITTINPDFVTIGADSKGFQLAEPQWYKIEKLIELLSLHQIEIRQKSNLERLMKRR